MELIRNIEIEGSKGRPILSDVFYKDGRDAKPIVIFVHGFKGFKDWGAYNLMGKYFANKRFVFVKFNFSHNGTSPHHPTEFIDLEAFGQNNFEIEMDDLGRVIDWIMETPLVPDYQKNKDQIYLVGHSRGGGIAVLKAFEDKRIKKLATWAGVNDFGARWDDEFVQNWKDKGVTEIINQRTRQIMPLYYQLYENYQKNKDRFDIMNAVRQINIPFLAIQGTEDQAVPMEAAMDMKRLNQKIKLDLIPNGGHTFGVTHPFDDISLPFDAQVVVEHTIAFLKG